MSKHEQPTEAIKKDKIPVGKLVKLPHIKVDKESTPLLSDSVREQVAEMLHEAIRNFDSWHWKELPESIKKQWRIKAASTITIIERGLREQGWKSPEEVQEIRGHCTDTFLAVEDTIAKEVSEARVGYVKLADGQIEPAINETGMYSEDLKALRAAYKKDGWRKVILEAANDKEATL